MTIAIVKAETRGRMTRSKRSWRGRVITYSMRDPTSPDRNGVMPSSTAAATASRSRRSVRAPDVGNSSVGIIATLRARA